MLAKEILSVELLGSVALAHLVINLSVRHEAIRVGISQGLATVAPLEFVATEATGVKHIVSRRNPLESQKWIPEFGARPRVRSQVNRVDVPLGLIHTTEAPPAERTDVRLLRFVGPSKVSTGIIHSLELGDRPT